MYVFVQLPDGVFYVGRDGEKIETEFKPLKSKRFLEQIKKQT